MNAWAALGVALTALAALVIQWIKAAQQQGTGAKLEAGAQAALAARSAQAMADAAAQSPTTKAALVDRLNSGSF